MKFRDRYQHTETELFTPRIPWGLLLCLLFFVNLPFAFYWILKWSDEIDSAKLDLLDMKIMGWILVISVLLIIFRRLIWKFVRLFYRKGKDPINFQ